MHGEQRKVLTAPKWRPALRRELAALLALKAAALWLLWALCFSPAHRTAADVNAASRALGVSSAVVQRAAGAGSD
ncbi:MAG: cytochrome oxidase putative small subunit CydP [Steroidobacteraceae bacterium]